MTRWYRASANPPEVGVAGNEAFGQEARGKRQEARGKSAFVTLTFASCPEIQML
jgi:hypothetical protein